MAALPGCGPRWFRPPPPAATAPRVAARAPPQARRAPPQSRTSRAPLERVPRAAGPHPRAPGRPGWRAGSERRDPWQDSVEPRRRARRPFRPGAFRARAGRREGSRSSCRSARRPKTRGAKSAARRARFRTRRYRTACRLGGPALAREPCIRPCRSPRRVESPRVESPRRERRWSGPVWQRRSRGSSSGRRPLGTGCRA